MTRPRLTDFLPARLASASFAVQGTPPLTWLPVQSALPPGQDIQRDCPLLPEAAVNLSDDSSSQGAGVKGAPTGSGSREGFSRGSDSSNGTAFDGCAPEEQPSTSR